MIKFEMIQIKNYAENIYTMQSIDSGRFVKTYQNFDPEIALTEVVELF